MEFKDTFPLLGIIGGEVEMGGEQPYTEEQCVACAFLVIFCSFVFRHAFFAPIATSAMSIEGEHSAT